MFGTEHKIESQSCAAPPAIHIGLDTPYIYGIMCHMSDAELLLRSRTAIHGGVVEMVVWRVPEPVPPSSHNFKYRLVFLRDGKRVVGYDNEHGKGDHRHLRAREVAYRFVDVDTLMQDFLEDVEAMK